MQNNNFKNFSKTTGMQLFGKTLLYKNQIKIKKFDTDKNKKEKKNNFPFIKNVLENIPQGATHRYGGNFFKKGSHGFTYVFFENEWKRTQEIELREFMRL
jgi:hypothetical protein